jgi:hypothetical protein
MQSLRIKLKCGERKKPRPGNRSTPQVRQSDSFTGVKQAQQKPAEITPKPRSNPGL